MSRLRLCAKELTSLSKVILSALEKLLVHVCAFTALPAWPTPLPAYLPRVSACNDEGDGGNQRRYGAHFGAELTVGHQVIGEGALK